jgi:hypothetical protein
VSFNLQKTEEELRGRCVLESWTAEGGVSRLVQADNWGSWPVPAEGGDSQPAPSEVRGSRPFPSEGGGSWPVTAEGEGSGRR